MSPGPAHDIQEAIRQAKGLRTSIRNALDSPSLGAFTRAQLLTLRGQFLAGELELKRILEAAPTTQEALL